MVVYIAVMTIGDLGRYSITMNLYINSTEYIYIYIYIYFYLFSIEIILKLLFKISGTTLLILNMIKTSRQSYEFNMTPYI